MSLRNIPRYRCWAEMDLGALERNIDNIRAALPDHIAYVAVVKANAYGHGVHDTVARLMSTRIDCNAFAVANLAEAAEINEISEINQNPSSWSILILSAILPEEDRQLIDLPNVIPTVSNLDEVGRFAAVARVRGEAVPVHLKIDTGMGRMGVWHEEAETLYKAIVAEPGVVLRGVYTHFSSADSDPDFTAHQRSLFLATLKRLHGLDTDNLTIHADNSAGLKTLGKRSLFNAVRVGLLQFGVAPYKDSLLGAVRVEPVMGFHTKVGLVKQLPAGTGVSYGRSRVLDRPSRIAILTAGYGDGVPISLSNKGQVLIGGRRCPILGRVTMDQTIVDVTDLHEVKAGDKATFFGRQEGAELPITEFCATSDQIPWEVFCSITKRPDRVYLKDTGM